MLLLAAAIRMPNAAALQVNGRQRVAVHVHSPTKLPLAGHCVRANRVSGLIASDWHVPAADSRGTMPIPDHNAQPIPQY
jgi:hypothetical protein